MRNILYIACLALIVPTLLAVPLEGNKILVTYIDELSAYYGGPQVAAAIGVPGYAEPNLYTVVNLAFALHYGPADACLAFSKPFNFMQRDNNTFGNTEAAVQLSWLKSYHDQGIKVMVSAFGATETPTTYDPTSYCTTLAHFAKNNHFDGIDLDYEDTDAMIKGTGEDWLIKCTQAIRKVLPKASGFLLSHAPQAPYFAGKPLYPNGGYLTVHQEVGDLIDYYNVQFYNQGDTTYDTYELLFIQSVGGANGTAVQELMNNGIPKEKIVVGKPTTLKDANNTGYVNPADLHDWSLRAYAEIGWSTGIMNWQFLSDQGQFVSTYINGL